MKTRQAITFAGSPTALARILGISSAAVHQWGEDVPKLRVYELREQRPEWFKNVEAIDGGPCAQALVVGD